jgi:hypothetical protein
MLMVLVIDNNFDVHQMDIKIAFLKLQKIIYMEQPQGFIQLGIDHNVYKYMTHYGFKKSSRTWYEIIDIYFYDVHLVFLKM